MTSRRATRPAVAKDRQRAIADLEASVLGGIILQNSVLDQLSSLEVDDFAVASHRHVFTAIRNIEFAKKPIDTTTIEVELAKAGNLDGVGGIAYLGELALRVPTVENVVEYARQLKGHSLLRKIASATSDITERSLSWEYDADELLAEAIARLDGIKQRFAAEKEPVRLISVGRALEELEALAKAPVYPTPFPTLNEAIGFGGFLGTQVYTLAAGTGRGKTSWVACVAAHAAQTVPVLVASYEMKPGYFIARRAAGALRVHSNEILRGNVSMRDVLATIPYGRFFMLHRPSLAELRLAVTKMTQRFGVPPLVIVDYLQKLADQVGRGMQRYDARAATTEASETLCEIADSSAAAIVAVSAIGRHNNKRTANPRQLEPYELVDVAKESGAVEYDGAGMIVLSLSKDFDEEGRIATMTLAKTRFGEECHIDSRYVGYSGDWFDRGRVSASGITTPTRPALPVVREKILAALAKHGPQTSAGKVYAVTGGTKALVLAEVRGMLEDGGLVRTSAGIHPPIPEGVAPHEQTAFETGSAPQTGDVHP